MYIYFLSDDIGQKIQSKWIMIFLKIDPPVHLRIKKIIFITFICTI